MQGNADEFVYVKFDRNRDILKQSNIEMLYRRVNKKKKPSSFFVQLHLERFHTRLSIFTEKFKST